MRARSLSLVAGIVLLAIMAQSQASMVSIDFDDGTEKAPIEGFYSDLGVTFADARWGEPTFHQEGTPSAGLYLESLSQDNNPQLSSPIIGLFDFDVYSLSILAVDVGINGAQIRAYDSVVGGKLVASDFFVGGVNDLGVFITLTVSSPVIRRVEFSQMTNLPGDGVLFDNLEFHASSVPISATIWLFASSLGIFGYLDWRKKAT